MSHKHRSQRLDDRAGSDRQSKLRIIGGELRGRSFRYDGNPATRPMKDRVREAVFNLIGPEVAGKLTVDLFAGTGAMAFESLSRGASRALLIERHFPTARVIGQNAAELHVSDRVTVIPGDAFVWSRRLPADPAPAWLVFFCPPYDLFVTAREPLLGLIDRTLHQAPEGSVFVVESDARFDMALLPQPETWDVRGYPPAVVAVRRTGQAGESHAR